MENEFDDDVDEDADDADDAARDGSWLTYHYRLGSADTPAATGTIKAPSFLTAARRALARGRLAATIGSAPAYLRLRAAGEREVIYRCQQEPSGGADALRLEVVPAGSHDFAIGAASDVAEEPIA